PPLPLATAIMFWMLGSSIFCGPAPAGGCMGNLQVVRWWGGGVVNTPPHYPTTSRSRTLRTLAQRAEVFEREQAGVVAIAPGDLVGVAADRRHRDRRQRYEFVRLEDAERVGRLNALLAAAGAGAVVAQVPPGVDAAVPVGPDDHQPVGAVPAHRRRRQRFGAGRGHIDCLLNERGAEHCHYRKDSAGRVNARHGFPLSVSRLRVPRSRPILPQFPILLAGGFAMAT